MPDMVNAAWADVRPRLSVLIPFLRDNPNQLIKSLIDEAQHLNGTIEIIILDDGTNNADLTRSLKEQITKADIAIRLVSLEENVGRAKGRNHLALMARGNHLLFLDADMMPARAGFLGSWLNLADGQNVQVAFGGFNIDPSSNQPEFAVHRAMALKSDCLSAEVRALDPAKHLFTSNLLIAHRVFKDHNFDTNFSGWGWEDVEWAVRVSQHFPIQHPDIPAIHLGLDTVEALMVKYGQSGPNFAKMAAKYPEIVQSYPSYKAAQAIRRHALADPVQLTAGKIVTTHWLPISLRAFSLRVYRAAIYARALQQANL